MTALRQRLIEDLQLRNFSSHTVEAYVRAVARFARRFGCSPDQLTGEQVREHLLWMVKERRGLELEPVQPEPLACPTVSPRDAGPR